MRRRVRYVLLVPVLGVAFVTVVFYGSHRLRAPMEPVMVIAAASAMAGLPVVRRRSAGWTLDTAEEGAPDTSV
jgi:hypothetical protein